MSKCIVGLVCLLLIVTGPAAAGEGRTPIPFSAPVATPIVITEPGSYVVTRNLTATGPGTIIEIAASDVVLDLNGMVLDNSANPTEDVITLGVGSTVTIRNGTLVGGQRGIHNPSGSLTRRIVIEDLTIRDTGLDGILLSEVETFVVRRCLIDDTGRFGIAVDGGFKQGTIEDNVVRRTMDGICVFDASSVEVSNNRIREVLAGGPFGAGILIEDADSCLVSQNTVQTALGVDETGAPLGGIRLLDAQGCKIYNNLVANVEGEGIAIARSVDTLVLNNVVRGAGGDGLFIDGSGNHIDRNVLNSNGVAEAAWGLHFSDLSSGNTFGRNTMTGNTGTTCLGASVAADFCDDATAQLSFGDNAVPGVGLF